jgi:hypothetical protein
MTGLQVVFSKRQRGISLRKHPAGVLAKKPDWVELGWVKWDYSPAALGCDPRKGACKTKITLRVLFIFPAAPFESELSTELW